MIEEDPGAMDQEEQRIVDLVRVLCEAERELQELTGGQLDAVAGDGGKTYLLSNAQEKLRTSEEAQRRAAETHAAILDALPANIALIDSQGVIVEVNESWKRFSGANVLQGSEFWVGRNYVEICERSVGEGSHEAHAAGIGIRRVLAGKAADFSLEYACHSSTQRRWFRLSVAPVRKDRRAGAVVMHIDTTERRLAVEAMQSTMEEFRTLAEAMPQIVWMTRPDGWTFYFNQRWMTYTGLTLDDSLGDGWNKPFHPEDAPRAGEAWRKATSTVSPYEIESRLRRADGEYRWWLMRGVPQLDAAGKVLKWFGTCTDIHDLKLAELEVSRANRALQMLSACNEKLIRAQSEQKLLEDICKVTVDTGGYRLAWVGYARDDEYSTIEPVAFAGHEDGYLSEIKLSWSEDEPAGLGPGGRTVRSGQPTVCEDIECGPSFSLWVESARRRGYRGLVCLPLRTQEKTFGILALHSAEVMKIGAEELSLLMELADDLAFGLHHIRAVNEVSQHAALLDAASDAIIVRTIDNRILFWNKGAELMYGWSAREVLGDDLRRILAVDFEEFNKAFASLMQDGTWTGEKAVRSRDGREMIVYVRWTLLRDEEGKPKSILAIHSDITERKKLETQLLRVQRMESIGTLAGGIAHDLNNALAPILMATDVLRDKLTDEGSLRILAAMEASAQHGADLVRQVLSFARGVEGRKVEVNVVHLLTDIKAMIRDTFPKNIDFRFTPRHDLWTVTGDPTQLHQVFTNLCVNARDAMPNGGTLKVTIENAKIDEVYAGDESGRHGGRLFAGKGHRHRGRYPAGHPRADIRAVLHHQGDRQGNRAGAINVDGNRQEPRRVYQPLQRDG